MSASRGRVSGKTIALGDESELEIHGKGFRFVDPPKEMRAALGSVPCAARSAPWLLVLAGMRAALAASPASRRGISELGVKFGGLGGPWDA
ncbi:hypothetical protein B0H10DRAFT_2228206 [Mycena sp. CBHHK59/15]|nr:hypothetical protein B0H10DRAFT_2228206 [Mycena sp. CBHHK59/15]